MGEVLYYIQSHPYKTEIFLLSVLFFVAIILTWLWVIFSASLKRRKITWAEIETEKERQKQKKTRVKFLEEVKEVGIQITPEQYVLMWGAVLVTGTGISFLFKNFLLMPIVLGAFWFFLKVFIFQREKKKRDDVRIKLGSALQNLGAAYRTQKNWVSAITAILPMMESPLKEEFIRVKDIHQSGVPISEAFQEMMERLRVPEMRLFVIMVRVSEKVGVQVADGILTSASYFQSRRLRIMDVANAMLSALNENKWLVYIFIGVILYFRFFQEMIFAGFILTLIGKILLSIQIAIAVLCLWISFRIVEKDVR